MSKKVLRHGYTTGACAAAASAGAARMLVRQAATGQVTIDLPTGDAVRFRIRGSAFSSSQASCYVIKDAGDDPDVTHGAELHSTVAWDPGQPAGTITLEAGAGVGRVTKPGLAVNPGQPAINPVPQRMIRAVVSRELARAGHSGAVRVTISVPDGVERAARTLNARLGILGGLSILGTTGVVRPISHQAWRDTLDAALDVARAAGLETVVLSGGRTSEMAAETALPLAEEAFVLMGDHVGFALAAAARRGFANLILSLQFAKLVKVAAGHAYTHAGAADLDLSELVDWARIAGLDAADIERLELAHTAREAFLTVAQPLRLATLVADRALAQMQPWLPASRAGILLVDYHGQPFARFGVFPSEGRIHEP